MLGFERGKDSTTLEAFLASIHPEDASAIEKAFQLASSERKATLFESPDAVPLDEAFWLSRQLHGGEDPRTVPLMQSLAELYAWQTRSAEAERLCADAVEIMVSRGAVSSSHMQAGSSGSCGYILRDRGGAEGVDSAPGGQ